MAIDPMHLPILGDPRPVDPPQPVRLACALLLTHALVLGSLTVRATTAAGTDPVLPLVPLALTAWLALAVRAGRDWARPAVCLAAALSQVSAATSLSGPVELLLFTAAGAAAVWAVRAVYREDVREYFDPAESEPEESDPTPAEHAGRTRDVSRAARGSRTPPR